MGKSLSADRVLVKRLCRVARVYAILSFALTRVAGQDKTAAPTLPYVDYTATCPGEWCKLGSWKVLKPVMVYDTWQAARRQIAQIAAGEKVTARTGHVVTYRPGVIQMNRDLPSRSLKSGDLILTYTYLGEGFSKVWLQGKFHEDYDISFARWPDGAGCGGDHCAATYVDLGEKVWWVEVQLMSGRIGWVDARWDSFDSGVFDLPQPAAAAK